MAYTPKFKVGDIIRTDPALPDISYYKVDKVVFETTWFAPSGVYYHILGLYPVTLELNGNEADQDAEVIDGVLFLYSAAEQPASLAIVIGAAAIIGLIWYYGKRK